MAPSRRKGASKAAAAAAARKQWKVGDLVLAKVKGFPAWPATVSEPEKWGYSSDWKKVMVYFFGTNQIAFCNPVDVEAFTEEKKELFLTKRHGRSADFVRAVQEIVDSYEKLKEQSRNDVNSSGAATEDPAAGCSEVPDSAVSNATLHSKLKSSNSVTVKGEQSCSAEDVEASMEVDILHNREECEGVIGDMLEHKNSSTARRSSRSAQSQCSTEQGKISVRRSRSSFRLNSHKIQNSTIPSNHESKKVVAASNGILDSVARRSKRHRKSPYKFIQNVGSPVCNSNGTIDDNGSEVAMADSDTLSNNEVGAVESNHKTQLSEAVDDSERDAELSERLNLQIETVILRKKRKPARKRVIVDVVDCAQPDVSESGDLHMENVPSVCENSDEKNVKDGGDEHLPLVKRARVRMGKLLIEEEQLGLVNDTVENAVTTPAGVSSDSIDKAPVGVSSDPIDKAPVVVSSDSIDNVYCEDTLAAAKTSDFLPSFYSSTQVSHDRVKLWKAEKSNLSCSFDGEAALPPSKRLHRAMEAMSANSAEDQSCSEFLSASKMDSQVCHATSAEGDLSTRLERDEESELERENKSDGSPDDISGASPIPNLPEKITTPCQEASVGKNSVGGTIPKDDIQNDRFEELALCSGFENHSGSDDSGTVKPELADMGPQEFFADQLSVDDKQVGHDDPHANFAGDQTKHELTSGNEKAPEVRSMDNIPVVRCTLGTPETSENAKPAIDEVKTCVAEQNLNPLSVENIQTSTVTDAIQETKISEPIVACRASPVEQVDIPGPHPASRSSVPGSADRNIIQHNDYTPDTNLEYEKHASDKHKKLELEVSCRVKASGKSNNLAEVKSSLSSLEMMLSTLTRAKESIGRATRIAIDCAKCGAVTEVVDIIARNLERESSLHRKVDLFFLVDSIAQCSRGIKGGIGDKYTSAIQSTLPRFLSAAAPPGYVGRENRRQCMKVLKLWLERKVLSESIICQQLRRLDSLSCSSSTDRPSQRMTRTERSFDDPIREMEGMHVDEYGSNSSFQLPGFCMPRMLKDEDGASDSDSGSFEAVTPEHESSCPENHEAISLPLKEKHRHILEDVDGELEMEDVAPCEIETRPSASTSGIDDVRSSYSHEQQFRSSFGPPVPHDVPSQAPPLPVSPPPPPPPPPLPLPPPPSDMPHLPSVSHSVADSHVHTVPETMHSQPAAAAVALPQISDNCGSCSFSTYPIVQPAVRPGHNPHQADATSCNNGYFRPPHPPPSNQFVYFNDQVRRQGEAPPPPYCNRPQFGAAMEGARFYGDHDRAKSAPYGESWRFSRPPFPGPMHYEKGKSYQPPHYHGPSHEHVRTNHERPFPPPLMHHRNHAPNTHFIEHSAPVAVRAPGYWPPR